MSGSDRGKRFKTGLIAGIIAAIVIAAAFLGWGWLKSAEYEREAHNQTREYAAYTDNKIRQSCFNLSVNDKKQCVADARHEQRANERNEHDLVAQRQSALWAYVMGAAAVIGMGLSVIGVILVYTTFDETRKANEISETAHSRQSRAYIAIASMALNKIAAAGETPRVSAKFVNTGQTPALHLRTTSCLTLMAFDNTLLPQAIEDGEGAVTMCGSGGEIFTNPDLGRPLTQEDIDALKAGNLRIVAFAKCTYNDIFGNEHFVIATGWPMNPLSDVGMSPCGYGNLTSDDHEK